MELIRYYDLKRSKPDIRMALTDIRKDPNLVKFNSHIDIYV